MFVRAWKADDFTLQDVLPGRESNLRKQRVYVMPSAKSSTPAVVDARSGSVLIPLRVRAEENGAWQWSGTRNFYQAVREGVMSMNEEHPARSGSHFPEAAFMIQSDESGCAAVELPLVRNLKPSPCRKAQFGFGTSHKSAYLYARFEGGQPRGLAQLARALAWHARGRRFDSGILH